MTKHAEAPCCFGGLAGLPRPRSSFTWETSSTRTRTRPTWNGPTSRSSTTNTSTRPTPATRETSLPSPATTTAKTPSTKKSRPSGTSSKTFAIPSGPYRSITKRAAGRRWCSLIRIGCSERRCRISSGCTPTTSTAGSSTIPRATSSPQYDWLVSTLKTIRKCDDGRAVFVAVHYPPYSAAADFLQRGDPNLGPTPRPHPLEPLAMILQRAYRESKQYPDAVFSAHAHHYQRITYTCADGLQIPHLIVGCGGHGPIESLVDDCTGRGGAPPAASRRRVAARPDIARRRPCPIDCL